MKKLSVLFALILILGMTFTSCSNDDDSSTNASIEGKWNFNKQSFSPTGYTLPEIDFSGNVASCNKDYIDILAGGVVNYIDYNGSTCTYTSTPGTWSKVGDKLNIVVSSAGLVGSFTITSLTATELKIKTETVSPQIPGMLTFSFIKQ